MNDNSKNAKIVAIEDTNFLVIIWGLHVLDNIICNLNGAGVLPHHYFHITTPIYKRNLAQIK